MLLGAVWEAAAAGVTETRGAVTDPSRPTVLARVGFRSLTAKPLRTYVLADPAAATTETTTVARSTPSG